MTCTAVTITAVLGCYKVQFGSYRRFGATYRSHLQRPGNQRNMPETLCLTLEDGTNMLFRNVRN
jgi:hypothetical protein